MPPFIKCAHLRPMRSLVATRMRPLPPICKRTRSSWSAWWRPWTALTRPRSRPRSACKSATSCSSTTRCFRTRALRRACSTVSGSTRLRNTWRISARCSMQTRWRRASSSTAKTKPMQIRKKIRTKRRTKRRTKIRKKKAKKKAKKANKPEITRKLSTGTTLRLP